MAHCITQCIDCAYLALNCVDLEKAVSSKVNKANYKKGIQFPSKFLIRTCYPLFGSCLLQFQAIPMKFNLCTS